METFEVKIQNDSFKVSKNTPGNSFSVFNHATFHVIKKNDFGVWRPIEHRFGKENIPIDEIGDAIDSYYSMIAARSPGFPIRLSYCDPHNSFCDTNPLLFKNVF